MENLSAAKLLRIFIGENDKINGQPLFEAIVYEAKKQGLAGATAMRGMMGFGANSRVHTAKLLEISSDLPIIVEIIDTEEKIRDFTLHVERMFETSKSGGLITLEKAEVIKYTSGK